MQCDILVNKPATGIYEKLKTQLIKRLSYPEEQKTGRLIESDNEIRDRKSSQFLRHLRGFADTVFRILWFGQRPAHIQPILAAQKRIPLENVADVADSFMKLEPLRHAVSKTSSDSTVAANTGVPTGDRFTSPGGSATPQQRRQGQSSFPDFFHRNCGPNGEC